MKLPDVRDFDLKDRTVLLRTDYDVPLIGHSAKGIAHREVGDDTRIRDSLETINLLLAKGAKIIILSHLGRPEGKIVQELSLSPVAQKLSEFLNSKLKNKNEKLQFKIEKFIGYKLSEDVTLLENLRFNPGEEANDSKFAQKLASFGDFYVNNAFACSHREHASIVGLPKLLPHAAGLDLLEEVVFLSSVREKPKRPVVVLLGGVKKSKLETVNSLLEWVDLVLIGGKLADYPEAKKLKDHRREMAVLTRSGEDITIESAEKFVDQVRQAGTIIWSGPLGRVEDPRFEKGTKIFAEAMAASQALTIIGGGDTEAVLTRFQLVDRIDYVSSGGGAMLAFLAKGDLLGLKALRRKTEDD